MREIGVKAEGRERAGRKGIRGCRGSRWRLRKGAYGELLPSLSMGGWP